MSLDAAHLKEWESVVDAIAAMDSTDALPQTFEATDFLPSNCHLSPALIQALQASEADFESRSKDLFQPRTTESESFRPMPLAPTFTSTKSAESKGVDGADDVAHGEDDALADNDAGDGSPSAARRKQLRKEGMKDARDFYSRYLAMSAASGKESRKGGSHLTTSTSASASSSAAAAAQGKLLLGRTTHLTSGFLDPASYTAVHRRPDFMPIILIPSNVTSPLQLVNIHAFLTEGMYVDPPTLFVDAQTGATNVQDTKPDSVIVNPGGFSDPDNHRVAFRNFRVLDDPDKVDNWSHVCACVVNGKTWEFKDWFPGEADPQATEPAKLFSRICAFLAYFEEDKVPAAVQEWHVNPLLLTRRAMKTQQHIKEVFRFWEVLYAFLDQHPSFKLYDVPVEE